MKVYTIWLDGEILPVSFSKSSAALVLRSAIEVAGGRVFKILKGDDVVFEGSFP